MTHKNVTLGVIGLILMGLLVGPTPVLAAGPRIAYDLPLVPVDSPGFVRLEACVLAAEMRCEVAKGARHLREGGCVLQVRQTYRLHNADQVEAATLRPGVSTKADHETTQMPDVTLEDEQGAPLAAIGSSEFYDTIWELTLDPNARKTLVLTYAHPPSDGHFFRWLWEMSPLALWGTIDGARVSFRLPQYTTDDAFLLLEPYSSGFDGRTLTWEYESLENPRPHELLMLSPPTWRQINDLRASGAHQELADLYMSVREAAKHEQVPFPDYFGQILAELQAAVGAHPEDIAIRLKLAEIYRARANAVPEMRLNYLLLSAEELVAALQQRPGEGQLADALSRAYYDAARAASETGDPGGALIYLRKAGAVPGSQVSQEYVSKEDLFLRWALSLAEQGRVSEAIEQLDGILSPGAWDALLRYAPPLVSAHTEVEMALASRTVRYTFQLYPISAERTLVRIEEIARRLQGEQGCRLGLLLEADSATLELVVAYDSPAELAQRASDLLEVLSTDVDLVAAFVAAPWQSTPPRYSVRRGSLRDSYHYGEKVDLSLLEDVWKTESEYVHWRLIELRNASPDDARAKLEQSLGLIALREQSWVWEHLPSGSYWTYRVGYGANAEGASSFDWLVSWGQVRDLQVTYSIYHRSRIVLVSLSVVGGLVLLGGIVHLAKRRRTRSRRG